jgi:chromosomal replication initiator protein
VIWTPEEDQFVRECALARMPTANFARLLDRSVHAVRMRRRKLGLEPPLRPHEIKPKPSGPKVKATVAEMQRIVADHFEIPVEAMTSPSRKRNHARPRQVAMFFARERGHKSYPKIGDLFGSRDHTTVIHGIRQVERLVSQDDGFRHHVETLERQILSGESEPNPTNPQLNDEQPDFGTFVEIAAGA